MRILDFIKNLILGFWKNGFMTLLETILEHLLISSLVVLLIVFLCSNSKTTICAWFLIGVFALYSALKATFEIFIETRKYIKSKNKESKILILQKIGGKTFDLFLCVVGIFQALKIFSHVSKITKSASSTVSVVDDVAGAVSKFLKDIK